METEKFQSIYIDLKERIFLLNGEKMEHVSGLELNYEGGIWSLLISKDEFYEQAATEGVKG